MSSGQPSWQRTNYQTISASIRWVPETFSYELSCSDTTHHYVCEHIQRLMSFLSEDPNSLLGLIPKKSHEKRLQQIRQEMGISLLENEQESDLYDIEYDPDHGKFYFTPKGRIKGLAGNSINLINSLQQQMEKSFRAVPPPFIDQVVSKDKYIPLLAFAWDLYSNENSPHLQIITGKPNKDRSKISSHIEMCILHLWKASLTRKNLANSSTPLSVSTKPQNMILFAFTRP